MHQGFSTLNNSYVEMSRHVNDLHVYCGRDKTLNLSALERQLSLELEKGSSLFYRIASERGDKDRGLFNKVRGWVADNALSIGDRFHKNAAYYDFENPPVSLNTITEVFEKTAQALEPVVGCETQFIYRHKAANGKALLGEDFSLSNSHGPSSPYKEYRGDMGHLRHELTLSAARVAYDLLGESNKNLSTGLVTRFGENGHLAVCVQGQNAGVWHDFNSGEGGGCFILY